MDDCGDAESGGETPDEQSRIDPERSRNCRAPPVDDAVPEHERHVRPRDHDDQRGDACKGDDVFHPPSVLCAGNRRRQRLDREPL